jgi:hypothetical protein
MILVEGAWYLILRRGEIEERVIRVNRIDPTGQAEGVYHHCKACQKWHSTSYIRWIREATFIRRILPPKDVPT